uniref:Uncharacterized protein n=1 Tax=Ralstonia solanacearum TaxID=305 RepID=A0A0S4TTZ3_RALSL|nr:protein of unknown function [Ralstonia solanacearum]
MMNARLEHGKKSLELYHESI